MTLCFSNVEAALAIEKRGVKRRPASIIANAEAGHPYDAALICKNGDSVAKVSRDLRIYEHLLQLMCHTAVAVFIALTSWAYMLAALYYSRGKVGVY